MEAKAFENVRDQIGFCGIWCGSCTAGNGAIQELARKFEAIAEKCSVEKWVPKNFDFKGFIEGLASIQAMPLCPGCQKGGGPSACKIRICALEKGMTDCSECSQLMECGNLEQLEKSHPTIKKGLMEIKSKARPELIEKWLRESEKKWPQCILLCASVGK